MFFWTDETKRRVLYVIFPACPLHLARIEKKKKKTNETKIEFICIVRNQFRLFYDGNGNRMVNVNDHFKSIARCVKRVFNFSDYTYQSRCLELNKSIFNFCVCQTTTEKQNIFDVIFKNRFFVSFPVVYNGSKSPLI